jgi:hypothetical protein
MGPACSRESCLNEHDSSDSHQTCWGLPRGLLFATVMFDSSSSHALRTPSRPNLPLGGGKIFRRTTEVAFEMRKHAVGSGSRQTLYITVRSCSGTPRWNFVQDDASDLSASKAAQRSAMEAIRPSDLVLGFPRPPEQNRTGTCSSEAAACLRLAKHMPVAVVLARLDASGPRCRDSISITGAMGLCRWLGSS